MISVESHPNPTVNHGHQFVNRTIWLAEHRELAVPQSLPGILVLGEG